MSSSGSVVLEKKILKWSHPIFAFLWLSPLGKEPGPSFQQSLILFTQEWFVPNLTEVGLLVLEKIVFNVNACKYGFPYCGPSQPPGTMIWINLNLHYIRKLSCKYELFWFFGSWEEDFYMTPPHFCNYLIFEEDLALNLNNLEFPLPKDYLYHVWLKLACWIWRRRFFSI
jgi:hypothetical protein